MKRKLKRAKEKKEAKESGGLKDLYENLHAIDIIERIERDMKANGGPMKIIFDPENLERHGKIGFDRMVPHESPWIHTKQALGMRDDKNFDILWNYFGRDLGQPPTRCQSCWKVVVRPQTVVQLMQLHGLQVQMAQSDRIYGCKCGIEVRSNVCALYGGYFYTRSLEEGRETHEYVKDEVNKRIGDIPVFLKRGCTELELMYGDPDKWHIRKGQKEFEEWILSHFEFPEKEAPQPEIAQTHIRRHWIDWAASRGDETYEQLISIPLHATYKHYEKS